MPLIDTHAHLDEESFDVDRQEVLARAIEAGVEQILTIGTTLSTSLRAVELAAEFPMLFAVVGIQPNYVSEAHPDDWDRITSLVHAPKVVGIGETGLDRYWKHAPFGLQTDYFQRHLQLSQSLNLPVVIHCREAEQETVEQLQIAAKQGPLKGVMHSFTGSWETAQACLDLGMYISFAGMTTFKANQALRDVAARIPADRIVVETDSPYLAPREFRGKRNEPAWVRHTAFVLAGARGETLEQFSTQVTENARRLFNLPAPNIAST